MLPLTEQSWTPPEASLFASMCRAALCATLDDGPEVRAGEGAGFEAEIVERDTDVSLRVSLDARRATLRLRPVALAQNTWRDAWFVQVERDAATPEDGAAPEVFTLHADSDAAVIDDARRAPLRVRLLVHLRAFVRPLDGAEEHVPAADVGFYRYTWQSSASAREPLAWSAPTAPEPSPEWRIDLTRAYFLGSIAFELAPIAPDATITLEAFSFLTPDHRPPKGCFTRIFRASEGALTHAGTRRFEARDAVARMLRLSLSRPGGAPEVLHVTALEAIGAELFGPTLRATLRRAFALHAERTLVEVADDRGSYAPSRTYAETFARAMGLAHGLAPRIEPAVRDDGRVVLAVMTRNRPEWIMADLAALERGYVLVPIAPEDPDDRLGQILATARPDAVVCEASNADRVLALGASCGLRCVVVLDAKEPLARGISFDDVVREGRAHRAPEAVRPPETALYSVLFTSGSTGAPKGAMRTYAGFHAMVQSFSPGQSSRHLSFQPLSHLSERMHMPWLLAHGVTLGFSRGGQWLRDELRAFGPTHVASVPRLYDVLYASYQRRLRALEREAPLTPRAAHEATALAEARASFGDNVQGVSVGSAPVSPEVLAFLRRCFADLWVSEGYGSTEVGTITHDGVVSSSVDVKLIARDADDEARGQGEVWVRSPHAISGYLGDESATRAAFDADGYFATGDLGARAADGTVRVIGRLRNTVKLAQGEFVSVERIEGALATSPLVEGIFVHAAAGAEAVVALVVPRREALAELLDAGDDVTLGELCARPDAAARVLSSLRLHGRRHALHPWELPRALRLDPTPFTVADGRLTPSGKLARAVLTARHAADLEARPSEREAPETSSSDDGLVGRVTALASRVVGRAVTAHEPIGLLGGDSFAAAEILAGVGEMLGREVPLGRWFESRDLDDLVSRITHFSALSSISPVADQVTRDLALTLSPRAPASSLRPLHTVLLTGATGFLGAHLVESLTARADVRVVCLVRADDDRAALVRLTKSLAGYGISVPLGERVKAVAADLGAERLGLSPDRWNSLGAEIDAIAHAGARVSWLASYEGLRAPNVLGTHALLSLALEFQGIPMHFVSTISTTRSHGDEATMLSEPEALASSPYALSKWVAESLVRRAGDGGLPIAVHRPSMIAAHSLRGSGNPDDFIHRYIVGAAGLGLALDLDDHRLDMTPVDFVADAIAALVHDGTPDGFTTHLTNIDRSLTFAALGRALRHAGLAVAPASYETFRAALLAAPSSRLGALASYFPERGFGLHMGPWPHARTDERLRARGVVAPAIDDGFIARTVASLRTRGALP